MDFGGRLDDGLLVWTATLEGARERERVTEGLHRSNSSHSLPFVALRVSSR